MQEGSIREESPALDTFITQLVLILVISTMRVQCLILGIVELQEIHIGPLLKSVRVLLDGIPFLQCANHTTQLAVGKLAGGISIPLSI